MIVENQSAHLKEIGQKEVIRLLEQNYSIGDILQTVVDRREKYFNELRALLKGVFIKQFYENDQIIDKYLINQEYCELQDYLINRFNESINQYVDIDDFEVYKAKQDFKIQKQLVDDFSKNGHIDAIIKDI